MNLGVPSSPLLPPRAGYRVKRELLQPCNIRMGSRARHLFLGVGAGAGRASTEHLDARRVSCDRHVRLGWIPAQAATSGPASHLSRKASAMQACSKSVSCATYLMPRHYQVLSIAFHARGESKGRPRVPRLPRFVVRYRGP
ncbi:hypothetical protein FXO37_36687 [Capsicum annuum]|nr:hypothetical protein FXO37_36687 [Capsicum annuum]